ncbi:hypothetical protein [Candidatus Pantoea formicae]|uniref:hypothetical protein n=1 Tax=Candidatus Pantoea formicae TaxID=2608355 RepID=UPI003EDA5D00
MELAVILQAPMARTLCSSGGPLLSFNLVIASKGGHFLPPVQLVKENFAINGTGRDVPGVGADALLFGRAFTEL